MQCLTTLRKKMSKFYFLLWSRWAIRLTLCTLLYGAFLSSIVTGYIYIRQGLPPLDEKVYLALFDIFHFWFLILGNIALLLALFRGMKYLFNTCHNGYVLELFTCPKDGSVELIQSVDYGDLVKVWRKWFMLIIWISVAQMIVALVFSVLLFSSESIFSWFNSYVLYGFILLSGYFSFIILGARCKRVRISKC